MIGFSLKKWLGALLQPFPLLTFALILAFIFQLRGYRKLALGFQGLSLLFILLLATPPLSGYFIKNIESDIPPFEYQEALDYIVVLGCGHINDANRPITGQLAPCSLYRTTEGMRLLQNHPSATLIFSGYGDIQPKSNAETNKEFAVALGVPETKIITEPRAKDTQEEAMYLKPLLQGKSFALVTSASHMPRALTFFRHEGLEPIPAPTGHLHRDVSSLPARAWLPGTDSLQLSGVATYEFLGSAWQKILLLSQEETKSTDKPES